MNANAVDDEFNRYIHLEARILKKSKQEVLEIMQQRKQTEEEVNVDSQKKSDDLKCSHNSENSPQQQQKIYPSRVMSPSPSHMNNIKNKQQDTSNKKKDTTTPPNKKKNNKNQNGDVKKITEYFDQDNKKKNKAKKLGQKSKNSADYTLFDSPPPKMQKSPLALYNKQDIQYQLHDKDKLLKEKLNQLSIAEIQIKEQQMLNNELRDAFNQLSEKSTKSQEVLKQLVIENEKLKRNNLKQQLNQNKMRLGEFIMQREKTNIGEVWVDGYEIKAAKEHQKLIESMKSDIENKKKTNKSKGDDQEVFRSSIQLKSILLQKEEQQNQELLERLEIEKTLFIKSLKRIYEEEHARFTKNNEWPMIGDRFQILSLLGKGGFSEVYKAYDLQEMREVACKIHQLNISWSDHSKQNYIKHAIRENRVHKELNHPNIVKLFDSVEIDKTSFCTVLELCDGVDLSFYLKKYKIFPEKEAKMIITQILSAVKYLNTHRNKIIHYDLKPQNILFHENEVKVSDFGLCKVLEDDTTRLELTSQGVGTYWYLPPECFHQGDMPPNISSKVDVWSVGVILFEMLFGAKPFGHGISQEKILKDQVILKSQQVVFPPKPVVSNECKEFIRGCLSYNQIERFDVIQASCHSYISKKL